MDIDRREFVGLLGCLAASAASGCASVVVTRLAPVGGTVRLPVRNYPQLALPGGYLRVQPEGSASQIYVLATDNGFVALSPICTHLGCTVNIAGSQLVCPCHGSTYDRSGRVLRGPAERSLTEYATSLTSDGDLVIKLESA